MVPVAGSFAQQPTDAPKPPQAAAAAPALEYDVVSIKEYKYNGGPLHTTMRWDENGVTAINVSLDGLICMAYGVSSYQVSGGPDWVKSSFFQVQARMDDAAAEALKKLPIKEAEAARRSMFQAVLADRFKLKVRRETRTFSAYALVVAKGGPSLKEAAPADLKTDPVATPTAFSGRGSTNTTFEDGAFVLNANAIPLDTLVGQLFGWVNSKVTNETGLKGVYDFKLRFAQDNGPSGALDGSGSASVPLSSAPSIFTALQEQLGLKLEVKKELGEALIMEHAEKPSEN
jgi:uncharacterized protein (TIGR03435 family)